MIFLRSEENDQKILIGIEATASSCEDALGERAKRWKPRLYAHESKKSRHQESFHQYEFLR